MIMIYLLGVLLFGLYMAGRKSVHTEIFIPAPPEKVWSVLIDVPKVREWNTVLIPVEGDIKIGSSVKYEFHQNENKTSIIPAKVKQIVENKLLNQTGGMPGVLTFDHKYIIQHTKNGTLVVIHEDYRGILVSFWNPAQVEYADKEPCRNERHSRCGDKNIDGQSNE